MTEQDIPDWLPAWGDWLDVGSGVWITRPRVHEDFRASVSDPEQMGSWWAHVKPDGHNDALSRIIYGPPHHTLVSADPLTIAPSILCGVVGRPDTGCGRHGFIRDGRWVEA